MKTRLGSVVISVLVLLILVPVLSLVFGDSYSVLALAPATPTPQSQFTPSNPTVPSGPPATSQPPPATSVVVHTQVPPTVPPPTVPPPTVLPPTVPPPTGPTNTPVPPPPGATPTQPLVAPTPTATKVPVRLFVAAVPTCTPNTAVTSGTRPVISDTATLCPGGINPLVFFKEFGLPGGKTSEKELIDFNSSLCYLVPVQIGYRNIGKFDVAIHPAYSIVDKFVGFGTINDFEFHNLLLKPGLTDLNEDSNIDFDDYKFEIWQQVPSGEAHFAIAEKNNIPAGDWVGIRILFNVGKCQ